MDAVTIRLLARDNNKKGDLFSRLVSDVFFALGYAPPIMNVHKSGREIDLESVHRTERRRVVAECKATAEPIGGDDINKFVGALDAEVRSSAEIPTTGYFLSLSGFKATALEQEKAAGGRRVVLLDGERVVEQLIGGHVLVSRETAVQAAARCISEDAGRLELERVELLGHDLGWMWLLFFGRGKQTTHYAIVHADGQVLARTVASAVVDDSPLSIDWPAGLVYLLASDDPEADQAAQQGAREAYVRHLSSECGDITFDGLPADGEAGVMRLRLELLYAPLRLRPSERLRSQTHREQQEPVIRVEVANRAPEESAPLGRVLENHSRLVVLAGPGAGKSTVLKRLALACSDPKRRAEIADDLPTRDWLPVLIRCRQLEELATRPMTELFASLPARAELPEIEAGFTRLISDRLRAGTLIVLVDGLDEIPSDQKRVAFVKQLRTFMARYPAVPVVITSREAGYRAVGNNLIGSCEHFELAELEKDDIDRIVAAWQREVAGERPGAPKQDVTKEIHANPRVRALATNPLLLMTLLLVKRWLGGELPSRRTVLYDKAIEVLLKTWNVEAHDPLDIREIEPQLAFVAFSMMRDGKQRVSETELDDLLTRARRAMPEYFGYTQSISVKQLIERVELRSSLLVMVGREVIDGRFERLYEFRHLTFQEYMAAVAVARGYYPDHDESDTLVTVLEKYIDNPQWREVIPLAAVLAGKRATPFVLHIAASALEPSTTSPAKRPWDQVVVRQSTALTGLSIWSVSPRGRASFSPFEGSSRSSRVDVLTSCLMDEVAIAPDVAAAACRAIAPGTLVMAGDPSASHPLRGTRYWPILVKVVHEEFRAFAGEPYESGRRAAAVARLQAPAASPLECGDKLLASESAYDRALGCLVIFEASQYSVQRLLLFDNPQGPNPLSAEIAARVISVSSELVGRDEPWARYAGALGLACSSAAAPHPRVGLGRCITAVLRAWARTKATDVQDACALALSALPVASRDSVGVTVEDETFLELLRARYATGWRNWKDSQFDRALLTAGFYLRAPWTDAELCREISRGSPATGDVVRDVRMGEIFIQAANPTARPKKSPN
jgi:hypothetical protein